MNTGLAWAMAANLLYSAALPAAQEFRAGAAEVDISPTRFPILVSGGFLAKTAEQLESPLMARAVVLDDGARRVAIAIVDSLMMPRELLDEVKQKAALETGVAPERMLIAATHTHSAPPVMGALGTDADAGYAELLRERLAGVLRQAAGRLESARLGWTSVAAPEYAHSRRWILRPDKVRRDPFGELTVRANMHPGYQNPEFIGPSGPVDPELSLLAIQSKTGRPLAVLANYSMHYVGVPGPLVSPDYFGHFSARLKSLIDAAPEAVVMMSQGTSGDLHWMDYSRPKREMDLATYAAALARLAASAYREVRYRDWVEIGTLEQKLELRRRVPSPERLAWAKRVFAAVPDGRPRNQVEVYAREQLYLAAESERELKLQALRLGDLAIAALPNEVFAITGLKIKGQSPFAHTFTIELANGAEGYIPPPEQHALGGYTTWPARTAALEVEAEPKITETVLGLLEKLAGKRRRRLEEPADAYAHAVLRSRPAAYWRFADIEGRQARDWVGAHHGIYETGYALYLDGMRRGARAVHLAGGSVRVPSLPLGERYTVELIFWNGLDNDAREVTGYLWSYGDDVLGIHGTAGEPGRLFFGPLKGRTVIAPRSWNHVAVVRDGARVAVYLNGEKEIGGDISAATTGELLFGAASGQPSTFEGRLDEAALFTRPLRAARVRQHAAAASSARVR